MNTPATDHRHRETSKLEHDPAEPRPPGARRALLFLAVLGVGFAGFVALRVAGALEKRTAEAEKQENAVVASRAQAAQPPSVEVVRGKPIAWQAAVPLEGSLLAQRTADLGFKAPGRLARISAKVGDRVGQGKVLATLETSEVEAQVKAAEAQVAAAEAQAALATDAARRTAQVVQSGAQSEATGVQAEKQKQLAEAQANAARAQSELVRTTLANHTLAAPFAGTIIRAPTAPGAVVAPGVALFHLADLGTLRLVGSVSPDDAALVKVGTPVEVRGDDGRTVLARGQVSAVVPALDATTKRLPVEATIVNDGREPLIAGTVVRALVKAAAPVTVLSFPHTVLRPGTQNEVLVVAGGPGAGGAGKGGKLAIRRIEHVVAEDGSLLVRKGLGPDDDVVASPWPEAQDGQPVGTVVAQGAMK